MISVLHAEAQYLASPVYPLNVGSLDCLLIRGVIILMELRIADVAYSNGSA